jgi:hypothetical protein
MRTLTPTPPHPNWHGLPAKIAFAFARPPPIRDPPRGTSRCPLALWPRRFATRPLPSTRARRPAGADAEEAELASAHAALAANAGAVRAALPELGAAIRHHAETRAGALDTAARLLRDAPLGAVAFTAPHLAPLRDFVALLVATEAIAADLAEALMRDARARAGLPPLPP